jgi:hypothetical protein
MSKFRSGRACLLSSYFDSEPGKVNARGLNGHSCSCLGKVDWPDSGVIGCISSSPSAYSETSEHQMANILNTSFNENATMGQASSRNVPLTHNSPRREPGIHIPVIAIADIAWDDSLRDKSEISILLSYSSAGIILRPWQAADAVIPPRSDHEHSDSSCLLFH